MTTDPFTTAAREEAERRWPGVGRGQSRADLDRAMRGGFEVGAEWGRDQTLAQEPTDAEAQAARAAIDRVFGWQHLRICAARSEQWMDTLRDALADNALSAARTARRDEEKR